MIEAAITEAVKVAPFVAGEIAGMYFLVKYSSQRRGTRKTDEVVIWGIIGSMTGLGIYYFAKLFLTYSYLIK